MPMPDPNSFGGKVLLSFIDKVILGIAAALIVFQYQSSEQRKQKLADETTAIARGYTTDLLIEQRKRLTDTMSSYFDLVDALRASGHAAGDDAKKLRDLETKILGIGHRLNVSMSERGDQGSAASMKMLLDAAQGLDVELLSGVVAKQETDAKLAEIVRAYGQLLTSLRRLTVDSLQQ